MPCEAYRSQIGTCSHCSRAPWAEGVPDEQRLSTIGDFTHAAEVIRREVPAGPADLLAFRERACGDGDPIRITFLADRGLASDHLRVGLDDAVLFLDDPHAPLQTIVRKLAAVRPHLDRHELVPRIPLERARPV